MGEAGWVICSERNRLLALYKIAASDYSRVVMVLARDSGVMRKDEYMRIKSYSEEARRRAEKARTELDEHVTAHGCEFRVVGES